MTPNSGLSLARPHAELPVPDAGRVGQRGHDSTTLQPGQLVLVDSFVESRDDPDVAILVGLMDSGTEKSKKLAYSAWRDGCWATHAVMPLENATPLGEDVLVRQQDYGFSELLYLTRHAVAYGAVSAIDFSPFQAHDPVHIGAAIPALRPCARVALIGGVPNDVPIPYWHVMVNSIEIRGRWVYSRKEIRSSSRWWRPAISRSASPRVMRLSEVSLGGVREGS